MASRTFILIGARAGQSGIFGPVRFEHGRGHIDGLSPEDLNKIENLLRRFYSAEPEGPMAEAAQAEWEKRQHGAGQAQGERDDSQRSEEVPSDAGEGSVVQPEAASNGGGDGPAATGDEGSAATGEDGQSAEAPVSHEKLLDAIFSLDPENDSHWNADGAPAMKAVEAAYGSSDILRKHVSAVADGYNREVARERAQTS